MLMLGLIARVMERQAGVTKFPRQFTIILLAATATVAALLGRRDDMKVLVQESKKATGLNKEKLANDIDALRVEIAVVEAELEAREDDAEMDEED
ncbi:MAG TPA: hypothetical protein EYQ27_00405 [Gemmatimonadetes bacterium]|nr:hypothetical protein [Gemmatimonadota bacterium]